jgi:hypothetical protein
MIKLAYIGKSCYICRPLLPTDGNILHDLNDQIGGLAQLVERLHGMQEVIGSIPLSSTKISLTS